jgi:hypothetical protein
MALDLSRDLFDPTRRHRGVYLQQGRLQLDADWNEQADVLVERQARAIADMAGPVSAAGAGFRIDAAGATLAVQAGRCYLEGLLCELPTAIPDLGAQPDLPGVALPTSDGTYLAYLEAWERELSAAEDPSLLDPALGGERTAGRRRLVTQVRFAPVAAGASCGQFAFPWTPDGTPAPAAGTLAAGPLAGVSSFPDQLYRIEVHAPGAPGTATWKWARDGASVERAVVAVSGTTITFAPQPVLAPGTAWAVGDWVELTDEARALRREPGVLAPLAAVDLAAGTARVGAWPGATPSVGAGAVLRKWGGNAQALVAGAAAAVDGVIELRFGAGARPFLTGEHWLVATRAAVGVLWPQVAGVAQARAPRGPRRRFGALALVRRTGGAWSVLSDCRPPLRSLAATLDPNKVDRGGDAMTGPLTVTQDLLVSGQLHAGGSSLPPAGVRLEVSGGALALASGAGPAGLRLANGGGEASLRLTVGGLVLEGAPGSDLVLREGGADRVVVRADGNVGFLQANPQAPLHTGGLARAAGLVVSGTAATGSFTLAPGAVTGHVLTSDASGRASWQQAPTAASGSPVFFPDPIPVASGYGQRGFQTFAFSDGTVSDGASAVILEATAWANYDDNEIRIRRAAGAAELLLLRTRANSDDDDIGWANQGIYPLQDGSFQWGVFVVAEGEFIHWEIRAVAYFL